MPVERQYLVVVRHGRRLDEVEASWRNKAERPWDPPLCKDGASQVVEAAEKLSRFGFQRLVVSPFQRCLETANQMSAQLVLPPSRWQVDTAVCEVLKPSTLVGSELPPPVGPARDWMWNGNTVVHFLTSMLGTEAQKVSEAASEFPRFPESTEDAHARYAQAFEDIADRFEGQHVLVVSHGEAVARAVTRLKPWAVVYDVQHCGFAVTFREKDRDGDWGLWQFDQAASSNVYWTKDR